MSKYLCVATLYTDRFKRRVRDMRAAVVLTNTAIVASDLFPIQLIDDGQEKVAAVG